jgi:putative addiction module killer protein
MVEVRKTDEFESWFTGLRDRVVRVRIQARIDRLACGNPGQHRTLTGGVSEMKVDVGPGYRVYFTQRGPLLIILLCGGDKSTQQQNIEAALAMAGQLE